MIRALLLLAGASLVMGAAFEQPAKPVILSPTEAMKQGRELVKKILSERPAKDLDQTGVLKIRDAKANGKRTEIPLHFKTISLSDRGQWIVLYETTNASNRFFMRVVHEDGKENEYRYGTPNPGMTAGSDPDPPTLRGNQTMTPFAGSDFWVADLGLEFFHWPEQRLLRKEIRRGQSCAVLESINPHPEPGAYSRVLSWIDIDTDGIINAEAYDAKGKLLKEFAAKSFKKINGEWELKAIEMLNYQTKSQTTIEFDLGSK